MSLDLFIVLSGDLPDLKKLGRRLAERGGVGGTWKTGVTTGGVRLDVADWAAPRLTTLLAGAKKRVKVGRVLTLRGGSFEDAEDVGEALIEQSGGAMVSESGAVLLSRTGPKKPPVTRRAAPAAARLDVSIPAEVAARFGASGEHYQVHPRVEPTGRPGALIKLTKALPQPVPEISYDGSPWSWTRIDNVVIRRPRVVFRTEFDPWYVKQTAPEVWTAMLHFACGLARMTRGVLLRPLSEESDVRYDFAPDAPLPPTAPLAVGPCAHFDKVTLHRTRRGMGEMVGIGQKVSIAWSIPGETTPAEAKVVIGAPRCNPALACLHGEQMGTTLRLEIEAPRGMEAHVPPCPSGARAVLEVTLAGLLR